MVWFRLWIIVPLILAGLIYQGYWSVAWMHSKAVYLAPYQQVRAEAGEWLEQNAGKAFPVLSGDLGSISYHAMDVRFIDLTGLTSKDVLSAYKHGQSADSIIQDKSPKYLADTFNIVAGSIVHGRIKEAGTPVWGRQIGNLAIAITDMGVK
jgi:hypothetical protein